MTTKAKPKQTKSIPKVSECNPVLLVPDVMGWAWWRRCTGIQKFGKGCVTVICERDLAGEKLENYSGHLCCSWPTFPSPDPNRSWALVSNEGCQYQKNPNSSVYQERMATNWKNADSAAVMLPRYHGLITVNASWLPFLTTLNPNAICLRTGVDTDLFHERAVPFADSKTVRIGWCGKRSTASKFSPKGYDEVLRPLMHALRNEPGAEFVINDRDHKTKLSTSEMIAWYNTIDVFLITSCSEGTPSCALEAMACGRPVIGTNVGILGDVNSAAHEHFGSGCVKIVPTYRNDQEAPQTVAVLKAEITAMLRDHSWGIAAGKMSRKVVDAAFSWRVLADDWLTVIRRPKVRSVSRTG